jgi:RNA polymerase sigma-70 factor (ECF subfamily)
MLPLDIIFQQVYDVAAGGCIKARLSGRRLHAMPALRRTTQGHTKEGWAKMLPIYLAMVDGEDEKSNFESLYLTYRKLMFHVANGILNDEGLAEDAVHQAFLKILENFDKVGEISCHKTRSYVVIIVRNVAINMYNSRKRHHTVPIEEAVFCAAEVNMERTNDLDNLAEAVLKLPVIYKDALKLKYVQEFSNAEIAGMLGISEAAVRKRLERARRMLEEILRREDFCDED